MIQYSTPKLWFNFLKHLINCLKQHALVGCCPSITTMLPIKSASKCFQAGALQTKPCVLSRPIWALASRSISPNCLQIAKSELPPKSRHATFWLECRLSQALQMPGDENCRCVVAFRAVCFMAWQGWLRNLAVPHQHMERQPAERSRHGITHPWPVLFLLPVIGPFKQTSGKRTFKLHLWF